MIFSMLRTIWWIVGLRVRLHHANSVMHYLNLISSTSFFWSGLRINDNVFRSSSVWTLAIYLKSYESLNATCVSSNTKKQFHIHKQEKGLRINFSKQPSPLSAHDSWEFSLIWLLKQARTRLKSCVCVFVCARAFVWSRLTLIGLNIQIDICCVNQLCLAASHYIFVSWMKPERENIFFSVLPIFSSKIVFMTNKVIDQHF